MNEIKNEIDALSILAKNRGFKLVKIEEALTSSLVLGKNRKETGHTSPYNDLIKVGMGLGTPIKLEEGKQVRIKDNTDRTAIFNLNKNNKAYCGVQNGAKKFKDREKINIVSISVI